MTSTGDFFRHALSGVQIQVFARPAADQAALVADYTTMQSFGLTPGNPELHLEIGSNRLTCVVTPETPFIHKGKAFLAGEPMTCPRCQRHDNWVLDGFGRFLIWSCHHDRNEIVPWLLDRYTIPCDVVSGNA